jgi:hypothetical protein
VDKNKLKPGINSSWLEQTVIVKYKDREKITRRKVWMDSPVWASREEVQKRIDENPGIRIQRKWSSEPILTDNDKAAVDAGKITIDEISSKQIVRKKEMVIQYYFMIGYNTRETFFLKKRYQMRIQDYITITI